MRNIKEHPISYQECVTYLNSLKNNIRENDQKDVVVGGMETVIIQEIIELLGQYESLKK